MNNCVRSLWLALLTFIKKLARFFQTEVNLGFTVRSPEKRKTTGT